MLLCAANCGEELGTEAWYNTCTLRVLARAQRKEGGNVKSMTTSKHAFLPLTALISTSLQKHYWHEGSDLTNVTSYHSS